MNFDLDLDCNFDKKHSFVKRHASSAKIVDFTDKIEVDELMRLDVVNELNFDLPKKDESVFFITSKVISLLDVVHYIETVCGQIEKAIFYVYTINDKGARYISDLSNRTELKLIISDLMNSQRQKERVISDVLEKANVNFVFCHNHAKLMSIKIGDNYYTLTGSMNAGNNARVETLQIYNSEQLYNFTDSTFDLLAKDFRIEKRYEQS